MNMINISLMQIFNRYCIFINLQQRNNLAQDGSIPLLPVENILEKTG